MDMEQKIKLRIKRTRECILIACLTWLLTVLVLNLPVFAGITKVEEEELDHYLFIYSDEEGNPVIEVGERTALIEDAVNSLDLDNLEIYMPNDSTSVIFHADDSEIDTLEKRVREELLQFGHAKLVDESIATEEELSAQEQAKEQGYGIWSSEEDDEDEDEKPEKISMITRLVGWVKGNYQWLLTIIVSLGIIQAIAKYLYRKLHIRKKTIFLGGGVSSGKTTLRALLMNPELSEDELLSQSPTLKSVSERMIRDNRNNRLTLEACIMDNPGNDLHKAIDTLNGGSVFEKDVLIIVFSPMKENNRRNYIDDAYVKDQLATCQKFWIPLLKADTIANPESVIVFVNKSDLFNEPEVLDELFKEHRELIKKTCMEIKRGGSVDYSYIRGSVVKRNGLNKIMNILIK